MLRCYLHKVLWLDEKVCCCAKERRTGFAANGADRKTVGAIAIHVIDQDVVTAGHCNTIVLVDNSAVAHSGVIGRCQTKSCKRVFSTAKWRDQRGLTYRHYCETQASR